MDKSILNRLDQLWQKLNKWERDGYDISFIRKDLKRFEEQERILRWPRKIIVISTIVILVIGLITIKNYNDRKERERKVNILIESAERLIDENKLTAPKGNNALENYMKALKINPKDTEVREGIKKIYNKYINWGDEKSNNWDYKKALDYYYKASDIKDTMEVQNKIVYTKDKLGIYRLLNEAQECFNNIRLTTPEGNNAFDKYKKILSLDPRNDEAQNGITKIYNKYINWGDKRYNIGEYNESLSYYYHAKMIKESKEVQNKIENCNKKIKIQKLLNVAERFMQENKLTTPEGNNALEYYKKVLGLDYGNKDAEIGIKEIYNMYIEWADGAFDKERFEEAKKYYSIAKTIPVSFSSRFTVKGTGEVWEIARIDRCENEIKIKKLLKEAERFIKEGKLSRPSGESAFDRYKSILTLDPYNLKARDGIERIYYIYLNLADKSWYGSADWKKYQDRAREVKLRAGFIF